MHTRIRIYPNSVATLQPKYLLLSGDIETNPGPTGDGNLCSICQRTKVVKCTVCDRTIFMFHQNVNSLQNMSEEILMLMRDLKAQVVFFN